MQSGSNPYLKEDESNNKKRRENIFYQKIKNLNKKYMKEKYQIYELVSQGKFS
jgi:hypothetical protein